MQNPAVIRDGGVFTCRRSRSRISSSGVFMTICPDILPPPFAPAQPDATIVPCFRKKEYGRNIPRRTDGRRGVGLLVLIPVLEEEENENV